MPERRAVIVSACRTPFGRYGGALATVRPDDLAALVVREAVARAGCDVADVEDVILGAANQSGEDNRNVGRMAALLAGLPVDVAGQTVNRLCASGLQAIVSAAHAIQAGAGDLFVAGGVESMTRAPLVTLKPESAFPRGDATLADTTLGWRFVNPRMRERYGTDSMGETGENVAERYQVSRADQDEWALRSQLRHAAAEADGRFAREIVAVEVPARRGPPTIVERDEHPRPDSTLEKLSTLRPVFREGGSVTAGNAAGINDGAAAVVIADEEYARAHGLPIRARLVSSAVAGVEPAVMGVGPVPAIRKALRRAGLGAGEIDRIELNEAFASQVLASIRELGLDDERVNVNGGAIAVGHPLGASGARLVVSLVHELERTGGRYGLATMCVGVGQGMAAVIERVPAA
ncbi:MAG TPA: acetyl-CoA C-acyltransferase [Gaiellales bacterium]